MRKKVFGRKFKRTKNQRRALFRSLMNALVFEGSIKTTEAKAKSIKAEVEKLVTKAKNGGEGARPLIVARLASEAAADKMVGEIGPKFANRAGGYTRILKLGARLKDNAEIVQMSWVEEISKTSVKEPKRKTVKKAVKATAPKAEAKKETKKSDTKKKE